MRTRELAKIIIEEAFIPDLAYNDRVSTVAYYLEKYGEDLEFRPKHQEGCTCVVCGADKLIDSIDELKKAIKRKMD
jgi:hypothetical protein